MRKPWGLPAVIGDGEHQGHPATFWSWIGDWAWDDECGTWIEAAPEQEVG